jgi:hypothetical protein
MDPVGLLEDLRAAPFYKGQILRTRLCEGRPFSSLPLSDLLERVPRLKPGSLGRILESLGMEEVYSYLAAGLNRAFPPEKPGTFDDVVLVARRSAFREVLWQLICLVEALDEGRLCMVLASNADRVQCAVHSLLSTVAKADISYAISVEAISQESDFAKFQKAMPMVVVIQPETLELLLKPSFHPRAKERVLSCLGRVIVPNLDEWPPALATNTAFLLRALHVECAMRGVRPAFLGTTCPVTNLEGFVNEFWGKPLEDVSFVRDDSVESPPLHLINYSGAMVLNPNDKKSWIRESPSQVASDLLGWLVGKDALRRFSGVELHYVLDVSGSMANSLATVGEAVIRDLQMKLRAGSVKPGDRVKLTVFEMAARRVFPVAGDGAITDATLEEFSSVVRALEAGGGTNIPVALGAALESALSTESRVIDVILFSDGESPVLPSHRRHLLNLVRQACSEGRSLGLLYVVLDDMTPPLDPPLQITNLIKELGGRIVTCSTCDLSTSASFDTRNPVEETVLFVSGEKGLSEEVVQAHQTGRRRLLFTRDTSMLFDPKRNGMIDPKSIVAVVVSGRFASLGQIKDQVQHLGKTTLPVFILSEAEAWGQMVTEDFAETDELALAPLIWTRNPVTLQVRLENVVQGGALDADVFRYLMTGASAYDTMQRRLGAPDPSRVSSSSGPKNTPLPPGFEVFERHNCSYVQMTRRTEAPSDSSSPSLRTFSPDSVLVEGAGISVSWDLATAGLLLYSGAIVDHGAKSAQVRRTGDGVVVLDRRTTDRFSPLLNEITVTPMRENDWADLFGQVEKLGGLSFGPARLSGKVIGYRRFPKGGLDDTYDDTLEKETPFDFHTFGLKWEPVSPQGEKLAPGVVVGLANILRLTLVALFRYADQTILVYPDGQGCVWVLDLSVGGNGASSLLNRNREILIQLLRAGGRVLLDCPCEGGFASASTKSVSSVQDTGCPRCSRVGGSVLVANRDARTDLYGNMSKQATLRWLLVNGYLPGSAEIHLQEKYRGIEDAARIVGEDDMSRRGCMKLVRRILRDRLGLKIEDREVASFDWQPAVDESLGTYASGSNTLSMVQGLREWFVFDVLSHELFHNFQFKCQGLFNHQVLGESGTARPPFGGKLFLEGSAMWAASQVADALAIRSSLTSANLRQGDEYAAGFRLFKYLEESYGIASVLTLLKGGDTALATGGKIQTLDQLYSMAGIRTALKP